MKRFLFPIVLFIVTLIVVLFFVFRRSFTAVPSGGIQFGTPTPTQKPEVIDFHTIKPGTSIKSDVVAALGAPIRTDTIKNSNTLVYPSGIGDRPINIDLNTQNNVSLITEPIAPSAKFDDLASGLGQPNLTLYGSYYMEGFRLYVYLQRGVALLANTKTQEVRERWYFPPTTPGVFLQDHSPAFSNSPPPPDAQ